MQRVSFALNSLVCIELGGAFGDNIRLGSDAGGSAKIDDTNTTKNRTRVSPVQPNDWHAFEKSSFFQYRHSCVVCVLALNRSCRPATSSIPIMPGEGREITEGWGIATSRYQRTPPYLLLSLSPGMEKKDNTRKEKQNKKGSQFCRQRW